MKFREVSNDIANIADAADAISDPGAQTGRIYALQEMLTLLQEHRSRVERDCSEEQCLEIRCNDIAKVNKQLIDLVLTIGEMRKSNPSPDKSTSCDPK